MANNLRLQAVPNGFKQPTGTNGHEMKMAFKDREYEQMFFTRGAEILWTWKMSACQSVATYTPGTNERSLTHLQGGNPSPVFFSTLAPHLTKDSTIIYIAGNEDGNKTNFEGSTLSRFRQNADQQLRKHMASPPTKYVTYWTDKGASVHLVRTGFVFKPDGRYGTWDFKNGEAS